MINNLGRHEIDERVVAQADNEGAWGKPICVKREKTHILTFPRAFEIVSDKDILDGTPVFRGTRVPVSTLLESLENGASLDKFIENFPTVKREQAITILEIFKNSLSQLKTA